MEQLLRVGVISSTHGVRGEVKVYPTTDDVNRFKKLKKVVLDTDREYIDLEISGVKFFKNMVILIVIVSWYTRCYKTCKFIIKSAGHIT